MDGADPAAVSERAYERGFNQVGTLGSGNHFLEVQVVERGLRRRAAEAFGLAPRAGHGDDPLGAAGASATRCATTT